MAVKKIVRITPTDSVIYESVKVAAEKTGITKACIYKAVKVGKSTSDGSTWLTYDDYIRVETSRFKVTCHRCKTEYKKIKSAGSGMFAYEKACKCKTNRIVAHLGGIYFDKNR